MSNNLPQKQQRQSLPAQSITELAEGGKLLAQANFLGAKNAGEGFMIMTACNQRGEDLVSFQQRYHLRQGRFSMQAHEMLAQLVARGGGYKIIERSPEKASLKLWKDDNEYTSTITWEDAKEEPFPYAGNEAQQLAELKKSFDKRNLKNKYKTPRSRMQMLWARAVSDGVVVVDPGVRGGIYTPEETEDFQDAEQSGAVHIEETEVEASEAEKQVQQFQKQAEVVNDDKQNDEQTGEADNEDEKTPWDEQEDKSTDFTVCPFEDERVKGKKWAEMPDDWLKKALSLSDDKLAPGYKSEVEKELSKRNLLSESEEE